MANTYLVVKQLFFKHPTNEGWNVDVGEGLDPANMRTFSNIDKAEKYLMEQVEEYRKKPSEPKFERYELKKDLYRPYTLIYSQTEYNPNGVRKVFKLIKLPIL